MYASFAAAALMLALGVKTPPQQPSESTQSVPAPVPDADPVPTATPAAVTVPAGTPILVTLASELSSRSSNQGDWFQVVVHEDLVHQGVIVVPKGTIGHGEVTFASRKGGFGKSGIIGISLRHLDLNGQKFALDGRYREVGKSGDGAAAATMFAVGVFAGFVTGKSSAIPQGRVLKARTGEDISLAPTAAPSPTAELPAQP